MPSTFSLQQIPSLTDRKIFFDANVLIYLFWSTGRQRMETEYAKAFGDLLTQKNRLVVDYLVIAEVINVALRVEYKKHLVSQQITEQDLSFKAFRNSQDGQSAVNDIFLIVRHTILENFEIVGKEFFRSDIDSFLNYDNLDFNDKAILSTCIKHECVLITNDKDFGTTEVDLLTSNPKLLAN